MNKLFAAAIAGAIVASGAGLGSALAQPPAAAPAAAAPAGKLDAAKTTIDTIVKNPKAKAALEKVFPELPAYYDQIGSMTLTELIPVAQGAIDEAKIKALQVEFDKL